MAENVVNINLSGKNNPTVNITVNEAGSVSGAGSVSPKINFVATGAVGPTGATGATGSVSAEDSITQTNLSDNSVGSGQIINGSITHEHLANGVVYGSKILDGSITVNKISDGSITSQKIADGTITSAKLINGSITADKLQADIITSNQILNKSIYAGQIANNTIVKELLVDNSVDGDKIEDDVTLNGTVTVTNLDMAGSSPARITGPDSDSLEIKSNSTIDFKNTSNTTIASLDQNGNLTISGTVDGIDVGTAVAANTAKQTNTPTNITVSQSQNTIEIQSSDGSNGTLNIATTVNAGAMSKEDKGKLDTVETGAEANVQSDWNATGGIAFIANKPTLLQLGTTSTTALAGDTTTISSAQASAITANTAKPDLTVDGAGTVHANNYTDTQYSVMGPGNSYASGLVPEGDSSHTGQFLRKDGAWVTPPDTNTTYVEATSQYMGLMSSAHHDKLDGIATGATASPDLTVDGAGTIHANNVPTLNQDTTGNAATATALAAGNQTIDGDVNIGASQAGHDFTLHGATTQYANIVWDASMNFLKVADASKIVFGNGLAATDFDSSIQANGSNLVIYNDTGNVQIGDTVEITGDLTVTGTVDGIDIATDVAANTAKTSFPGFGTTAGTALEGNTTIPTQYTDSDAVSAVAAADDYLKNDASDTMSGSLTLEGSLFVQRSDGGNTTKTKLVNNLTTSNRTLDVPDASGTIALTSNITPTVIGQFSTRVSAYWSGRYYYGHASYGWNYFGWNYATTSKSTLDDRYVHMGMVSPMATDNVKVRATVRNDSNTEDVELCLLKGPRPNGSSSNISLTELGSVTVTISTVDLHYNGDIDVTDANLAVGDLVFLVVRRISSAANATKYIQVSATIYGE